MDRDGINKPDKKESDVFKIKTLELLEKLQMELDEFKESNRREMEVWNKEREELNRTQQEMLTNYKDLQRIRRFWSIQTRLTNRRISWVPLPQVQVLPVRNSETNSRSQEEPTENVEEADDTDLEESYEVEEHDLEENDAPAEETEENNDDEEEIDENDDDEEEIDENDDDEEEIVENDENNEEEQEEMEDPEPSVEFESTHVLEYTPVASETELRYSIAPTADVKRKASSLLVSEHNKKRRLTLVECPVCQESLPEMSKSGKILLMVAKCGHILCSNCAMRIWVQRRKRCPKCNTLYNVDELLPVYL